MYKRGAAANIGFTMVDKGTGDGTAGLTVTVYRVRDNFIQEAAGGTVTDKGHGQYNFAATATDMDAIVVSFLFTATGMIPQQVNIRTTQLDFNDTVRAGLTSLPNAAAAANGGLPTTNGTKINQTVDLTAGQSVASASLAAQAQTDVKSAMTSQGYTTTRAGYLDTLNGLVAAIWSAATSGLTTAGSIGKKLADWVVGTIDTYTGNTKQTGDGYALLNGGTATTKASVGTGVGQINLSSGKVPATIAAGDIATDAVSAAAIAAAAVTKIQTGLATPTNITAGVITTVTNLTNAPTAGDLTATMKASVTTAATAATPALSAAGVTAIVTAIWNALTSGMTTVGSLGKKLSDWVVGTIDTYTGNTKQTGDAFASLATKVPANLSFTGANVNAESKVTAVPTDMATATALNSVALEVNAALVKVNTLPESPASETTLEGIETVVGNIETSLTEARGELTLVDEHVTDLNLPIAAISESLVAIDSNLVEVMGKTEQLTFTNTGKVDASSMITTAPDDMALNSTVAKAAATTEIKEALVSGHVIL